MKKNTERVEGPGDQRGRGRADGKGGRPGAKPAKPKATVDQLLQKFAGAAPQRQNNIKLAVSLKSLMRSGR